MCSKKEYVPQNLIRRHVTEVSKNLNASKKYTALVATLFALVSATHGTNTIKWMMNSAFPALKSNCESTVLEATEAVSSIHICIKKLIGSKRCGSIRNVTIGLYLQHSMTQ